MQDVTWAQRPLPELAGIAVPVGNWELSVPSDVTFSRRQLARAVALPALRPPADDVERLLLTFEELASNGLRHGRSSVLVRVTSSIEGWLIVVTDAATDSPPVPALDRDPAHGGLGLFLVAQLCNAHGWIVRNGRKHVWAYLRPT